MPRTESGRVPEAYQKLVQYFEETARAPNHFVFAAARSLKILEHLADETSAFENPDSGNSQSFRELALIGLEKGIPEDKAKRLEYFDRISKQESLIPLLKDLTRRQNSAEQ